MSVEGEEGQGLGLDYSRAFIEAGNTGVSGQGAEARCPLCSLYVSEAPGRPGLEGM